MLSSLDLFSGIGGLTHALSGLAKPVAYCEWALEPRSVLIANMKNGLLPAAALCADVRRLDRAWIEKHAGTSKVDMIVGGFPCVGFSGLGNREGFEQQESVLFYEILRLTDELRCPALFLENVHNIVKMGMHDVAHELVTKRGYHIRWCEVSAAMVGAPHLRRRWYCLALRPGFQHVWPSASTFAPFSWTRSNMPARGMAKNVPLCKATIRLVGNSVVPDAARYAFLQLASDFAWSPKLLSLSTPPRFRLVPCSPSRCAHPSVDPSTPFKKNSRRIYHLDGMDWPMTGKLSPGQREPIVLPPAPPLRPPLRLELVFDPTTYKSPKPPAHDMRLGVLPAPVKCHRWSTPRHSNTRNANYLTQRTLHDLPTQVRFERSTRDEARRGNVNPRFSEWLMGYPAGWTKHVVVTSSNGTNEKASD